MADFKTVIRYQMDLDKGVTRQTIRPALLQDDAGAHRIVISCVRGGVPVPLTSEQVMSYFVREDGSTVLIHGQVLDGAACVTLPLACYAVEGAFEVVVRVSSDSNNISTIYWGGGAVRRSRTDVVVDPDDVVPSLEELLAQIAAMEAATVEATAAAAAARLAGEDASSGLVAAAVPWEALAELDEASKLVVLEAARPVLTDDVQAVFDGLTSGGSATLVVDGVSYTVRCLGAVHDTLMIKDGGLVLCRKIADNGTELMTNSTFEAVACADLTAVFASFELPCTVDNLLAGRVDKVSYAGCGAYLDGVHDDYEAMYRAHYIGEHCRCDVIQHGGNIYKANSGWLYVNNHNVDLRGSNMLIDSYNRYGTYWLGGQTYYDAGVELGEVTADATYWPSASSGYQPNGLFILTRPGAAIRYNDGEVTTEDRKEIVRHGMDGYVYSPPIDDAEDNTQIVFARYPETQLTFRGCTLEFDVGFASVAVYFLRCERSNVVLRDFVIHPNRRTTQNTGYRGSVFTLNDCADVTLENIKGINIAGKPTDSYPRGVAGYLLNAGCVLDLTVRNCNLLGYWGCVGLNGAKEVTFEGCELNRVDVHDYFRGLTVTGCRLYGQVIGIGYGKGAVAVSDCSVLTDWVHQVVNLRCDYGRYFEGEINISNLDAVYTGSGAFDLVSGVTLYSAASAAATGLAVERYPVISACNVVLRLMGDSVAGYVFNLPAGLESAVTVTDKRKVVEYANLTVYDETGALLDMAACSLGGVVKDSTQALKAAGIAAAAAQETADDALGRAVDLAEEVSQLSEEIAALGLTVQNGMLCLTYNE